MIFQTSVDFSEHLVLTRYCQFLMKTRMILRNWHVENKKGAFTFYYVYWHCVVKEPPVPSTGRNVRLQLVVYG